jgi:hypothetical protein
VTTFQPGHGAVEQLTPLEREVLAALADDRVRAVVPAYRGSLVALSGTPGR